MTIYLILAPHDLQLLARVEFDGGHGDVNRTLRPGDSYRGWSYADLRMLGNGRHEIQPRDQPPADSAGP